MKIGNLFFLTKDNLKGNRHHHLNTFIIVLLCVSLTVVSLLSFTLSKAMSEYKNDFRARTIEAYPYNRAFDEKTLSQISRINHVESIDIEDEMRHQFFFIENIGDEDGTCEEVQRKIDEKGALVEAWSLIGGETRSVIAGKGLDESPEFSCIIPHMFYPFDEDVYETSGLNYIDGESLIGKTLTLTEGSEGFQIEFFDGNDGRREFVPSFEIKLKIVGVYYTSASADGGPAMIYISENTGKELIEVAAERAEESSDDLINFVNRPEFHNLHITVDNFDNLSYVYNELNKMNISVVEETELAINPTTPVITTFFNVLSVLITTSTLIISFILILQSSKESIVNKKEEIGMLKAIGYKDKDIFGCVLLEQLIISLRGFFIGLGISAVVVTVMNIVNNNGGFANRIYIVSWTDYLLFAAIALVVVMIVPLVCESIYLGRLIKIQPREAMV